MCGLEPLHNRGRLALKHESKVVVFMLCLLSSMNPRQAACTLPPMCLCIKVFPVSGTSLSLRRLLLKLL